MGPRTFPTLPAVGGRQRGQAAQMLAGSHLQPQEQFPLSRPRQAAKVRGNASQTSPSECQGPLKNFNNFR